MQYLNHEMEDELKNSGVSFVRFVDVSMLPGAQNRNLHNAILIGLSIDPEFIKGVFENPDYMPTLEDAYVQTEHQAGEITDGIAKLLIGKGFRAISQSDAGLLNEGAFDFARKESVLPHKTVALLSGSGWIGKNNLFITPEYGAAQCLGTILTDAPLETAAQEPLSPKCGDCGVCANICEEKVLKGKTWATAISRDEIVDVYGCSTCLKCLVHCPRTRAYIDRNTK